jgi:hypothetical protein
MRIAMAVLLPLALLTACSAEEPPVDPDLKGTLVITVRDGETGAPIRDAQFYGIRSGTEEHLVGKQGHIEVSRLAQPDSEDGVRRWEFEPGWYTLRLEADDYWRAWTPVFRIEPGRETELLFEMHKNILLRVKVFDENGDPLPEGILSVEMNTLSGSMDIENGVGELWVEDDEVTLIVGKIWLKEYKPQSRTISLTPGEVNEVEIRLEK